MASIDDFSRSIDITEPKKEIEGRGTNRRPLPYAVESEINYVNLRI